MREEDCNDQVHQEDEAQKKDESRLRSGPKMVVAHKEGDLALGGDESAELAAMYRKSCAVSSDEETDRIEGAVRTLPIPVWEQARVSTIAPKITGLGPFEASGRKDRPTIETQQTLNAQHGVLERNKSLERTEPSVEKKCLRRRKFRKALEKR